MKTREPNGTARPVVEVEIHASVGIAIVTLRGDHDITTQPLVVEALERASEHKQVLVDLSACSFADSTVIGALMVAHADISQRDGRLEVVIPPEARASRLVADLTRLDEILPVHSTRDGVRLPVDWGAA